jgi:hypothetical protein
MISPKKLEANRRNARKSTGPRTPEGKARSRLNAVTHGMTGQTRILPGEDADEFDRRLACWTASLQPCNAFEAEMVRQAVESSWRLDRADRVWAGCLADRIATEPDDAAHVRSAAVLDLGRRLWADPPAPEGHATAPSPGPDDPDDPARLVNQLESTADGCRWLLDRWAGLRRALDDGRAWSPAETIKATRLLGKRPEDADDDPEVLAILAACFTLDRKCPDPFAAPDGGAISRERRSRREWRLARRLGEAVPLNHDRARDVLREIIDDAEPPLASLEQHHRAREAAQAAATAEMRRFDDSPEGDRLRRLQLRDTRALLRNVGRLRDARRRGYSLPKPPPAPRPVREPSVANRATPSWTPPPASAPDEIRPGLATREAWAPGHPEPYRPSASVAVAAPPRPPASRLTPRRSPRRFRPSARAAIRSIGRLGALLLALSALTALRTTAGSEPHGRPKVSIGIPSPAADRAQIRPSGTVSPPGRQGRWSPSPGGNTEAEGSSVRPLPAGERVGVRGFLSGRIPPNVQNRQNEPTEWPIRPSSTVGWPRQTRPADRSRSPPGREKPPSPADRPNSRSSPPPGVAAVRALKTDGPAARHLPAGQHPDVQEAGAAAAAAALASLRTFSGLGRRLPNVPRKILPRFDRRSPLPMNPTPQNARDSPIDRPPPLLSF